MPRYTYTAKSKPETTHHGEIEAESVQEAINKLTLMGYFPSSVKEEDLSLTKKGLLRFLSITNREIVLFTRQLSSLLDSGVNILNGLNIIVRQSSNRYLRSVISDVISRIKDGASLSESLSAHPGIFSALYTSLIHTGEAGGNINKSLNRLADFLEQEEEFRNSIRSSLIYPLFIFAVGALTIAVLLLFVIPKLVTMFQDMGQSLPLPTRILIGTSDFLRSYWWIILSFLLIVSFLIRRILNNRQGKFSWDGIQLKIRPLGDIILKAEVGRMMRTLSLLLTSGIPITKALEVSASVLGNSVIKSEVLKFRDDIAGGSSFSACLKKSGNFPEFVSSIVSIGEETGELGKSLMRIADDYERDVARALKTLTRMIEPVVILVMGLIVGFIVLSMLLPIFQINLIVK